VRIVKREEENHHSGKRGGKKRKENRKNSKENKESPLQGRLEGGEKRRGPLGRRYGVRKKRTLQRGRGDCIKEGSEKG